MIIEDSERQKWLDLWSAINRVKHREDNMNSKGTYSSEVEYKLAKTELANLAIEIGPELRKALNFPIDDPNNSLYKAESFPWG